MTEEKKILKVLTKTTYFENHNTGNICLSNAELKLIESGYYDMIRVWTPNHSKLKAVITDPQRYIDRVKLAPKKNANYYLMSYLGFEVKR